MGLMLVTCFSTIFFFLATHLHAARPPINYLFINKCIPNEFLIELQ